MRSLLAMAGSGLASVVIIGAVRGSRRATIRTLERAAPPDPRPTPHTHLSPQRRRSRAAQAAVTAAFPDAIDLIVLAIRAGHLPAAAVRTVLSHLPDAVRPAFGAVLERVDRGARFADALDELPRLLGPIAHPLADSFAATDRYGLPLAPTLTRLADEARRQRRRAVEIAARQLPVRLAAPLVLCTLPSFILLAVVPLLLSAISSLEW